MRTMIAAAVLAVSLAACSSGPAKPAYETPQEIAEAIGARVDRVTPDDEDPIGRELSATWRGRPIGIWVADDDEAYEMGLRIADATGFPYATGDGWVITAQTQAVADAAAAAAN